MTEIFSYNLMDICDVRSPIKLHVHRSTKTAKQAPPENRILKKKKKEF